ncbi:hypothetical protein [Parvularcula maris]|uniref:Uncharacterized protein n=1 Tax=Parvularcula maris TaxID=2965077 RepID=A0A9X2L6B8_9PROT|nr:hypothetical protein [Parvularcula maris]MCQ8183867.1 hypothetical protein [Parvularcula maris]
MLRWFLLVFGWASFVGSVTDGIILAQHLVLVALGQAELMTSVGEHIRTHLPFLSWMFPFADLVLPEGWAPWIFGLPAVVYFPPRILFSVVTGGWALRAARRLGQRSA